MLNYKKKIIFFLLIIQILFINSIFSEELNNNRKNTISKILSLKLSFLEWFFYRRVFPLKKDNERLEELELKAFSTNYEHRGILWRINNLLFSIKGDIFFQKPSIKFKKIVLPLDTILKISIDNKINSSTVKETEIFNFTLCENIIKNGYLILPYGCYGKGIIKKVIQSEHFAKNAYIEAELLYIVDMCGQKININISDKCIELNSKIFNITGKNKKIFSDVTLKKPSLTIWKHGKNIIIPKETKIFVATSSVCKINAILINVE